MPVTRVLTPDAVATADYPLAQTPPLGGEKDVYASTTKARILGYITQSADSVGSYTFVNLPSASPGPILAVVYNRLTSDDRAYVTYAGLGGGFLAPGYVADQSYSFPGGKAVELTGTFSTPTSATTASMTNGSVGDKIVLVEMPALTAFNYVGCTKDKSTKIPTATSKGIDCQLNTNRWVTQGKRESGELTVNGLDHGPDTGLMRIRGLKCVAMIDANKEDAVKTSRTFCIDWTPSLTNSDPDGDGESTIAATGMFSIVAILSAP